MWHRRVIFCLRRHIFPSSSSFLYPRQNRKLLAESHPPSAKLAPKKQAGRSLTLLPAYFQLSSPAPASPLPRHIAVQLRLFAVGLGHELLQLVLKGRLRRGLHGHCGLCRTGRPPAAAGAGTTALGPGRSGRLRAFLLGLGLLDGQIDFPSGETERIFTVTSCPSVR